jgi:hypothetical protein
MNVYYVARIGEDADGTYIDEIGIFATTELAKIGVVAAVMRLRNKGVETTPDDYHTKQFSLKETPLQAQVINELDSVCITCHPEEIGE